MFVSMMFICNEIAADRLFVSDVYDCASLLVICYVCGFHNAREIREVLPNFFHDLIKDKLGAVGVSGRDPADDDDDYTLE